MDVFNYLDKVRYKIGNCKDNRENPQRLKTYCFVPDGHPFPSFVSPEGNKVDINKGYKRFMKSGEYETHPSFVVSKNIYFDRKGQQIYFEPGIICNTPELICHCAPKTFENKELEEQYGKDLYDYEKGILVDGMPKVSERPSQDSFCIKGTTMVLTGGFYFDNEQAMTLDQYNEFESKLQDNAEFFTETKQQISNKTNISKENVVSRFIKNCCRCI